MHNKTIILMGNGPSLADIDFADLDGYDTFGLNVELLFDPQFIYRNEVKEIKKIKQNDKTYKNPLNNYLLIEQEKLSLKSVQINQILTDFISNDTLFSFDDRLTAWPPN